VDVQKCLHVYLIEAGMSNMTFDDPTREKPSGVSIGEELYDLSVAELTQRLDLLRAEIVRVEAEIVNKKSTKDSANAVFKI